MSRCIRCVVSGRVQGVWFRASTRNEAEALGVSGYARNLQDGRVEVLACGGRDALESLKSWLWKGPAAADVRNVECQDTSDTPPAGFATR